MTQTYTPAYAPQRSWLGRAEDFLDSKGKAAWIAATVAGFIVFWPAGLALLAYMIWSKRMFKSSSCAKRSSHLWRILERCALRFGCGFAGAQHCDLFRSFHVGRCRRGRRDRRGWC